MFRSPLATPWWAEANVAFAFVFFFCECTSCFASNLHSSNVYEFLQGWSLPFYTCVFHRFPVRWLIRTCRRQVYEHLELCILTVGIISRIWRSLNVCMHTVSWATDPSLGTAECTMSPWSQVQTSPSTKLRTKHIVLSTYRQHLPCLMDYLLQVWPLR